MKIIFFIVFPSKFYIIPVCNIVLLKYWLIRLHVSFQVCVKPSPLFSGFSILVRYSYL